MFTHKEKKLSPHPPPFLFELVLDIENYPKFLPWCKAARIHKGKTSLTHPVGHITADLIVGTHGLSETFTSHVTYNRDALTIHTTNIDGPFDSMQTMWQFLPHDKSSNENKADKGNFCMIDFSVELSFKQRLLQNLFAPFFENAIERMVQAFESHANTCQRTNINAPF